MAKVYLDTNYFIDLIEQRKKILLDQFQSHALFISSLSVHIYVYVYKLKIPNKNLEKFLSFFNLIPLDEKIIINSLKGPTKDFEDNLQLHSAAEGECHYFLTNDTRLLDFGFFGKVKIRNVLER